MLSDVVSTSSNQRRFDLHSQPFFNVVSTSIIVVKATSQFDVEATLLSDVVSTSSNQRRFDLHCQPFYNVVSTSIFVVKATSLFDVGATLLSDVVSTSLNQRRIDLRFQYFYNVVSTSGADVVSMLYRRLFARWDRGKMGTDRQTGQYTLS